jgi:hypothetical protein
MRCSGRGGRKRHAPSAQQPPRAADSLSSGRPFPLRLLPRAFLRVRLLYANRGDGDHRGAVIEARILCGQGHPKTMRVRFFKRPPPEAYAIDAATIERWQAERAARRSKGEGPMTVERIIALARERAVEYRGWARQAEADWFAEMNKGVRGPADYFNAKAEALEELVAEVEEGIARAEMLADETPIAMGPPSEDNRTTKEKVTAAEPVPPPRPDDDPEFDKGRKWLRQLHQEQQRVWPEVVKRVERGESCEDLLAPLRREEAKITRALRPPPDEDGETGRG